MKKLLPALVFCMVATASYAQKTAMEIKTTPVRWVVMNNYLKSDNGNLILTLPVPAVIQCLVTKVGETKTFKLQHDMPRELLPGKYDIMFWGIKIPSLAIEKAKNTRIMAGVLNSTVKGLWEVWTEDGTKIFSASAPKKVALVVGNYIIKTQGAEIKTTIRDGKISIFSFTKY